MINKEKNVIVAVTFPKEDAEHLQQLKDAFNKNGIKCSKSDILLQAFRDYLNILIAAGTSKEDKQDKEDKEEKQDA